MKSTNTFWNWFQDHHHIIKNIVNETAKNQKHISFWIDNYYKGLDYVLVFPKKENSKV